PRSFAGWLRQGEKCAQQLGFVGGQRRPVGEDFWGSAGAASIEVEAPDALIMVGEKETAIRSDRAVHQGKVDGFAIGIARIWLGPRQNFHGRFPARAVAFQEKRQQAPRG